jgi:antitoxin MazE
VKPAKGRPPAESTLLSLRQRGVIVLPPEWRTSELFEAIRRSDGVIELHPRATIDADQAWFWSQRWQRMEREAQADIESGAVRRFDSAEELLADLEGEGTRTRRGRAR